MGEERLKVLLLCGAGEGVCEVLGMQGSYDG